jgi:hypothetical protein
MAIVIYVHRPKRHAKPKAAPATALAGPVIVTASRKRRGPPAEVPVDPEAQERVRAFFERMGLKSRPTPERRHRQMADKAILFHKRANRLQTQTQGSMTTLLTRQATTLPPAVLNYAAAAGYLGLPSANALRQMVCRKQAPPSFRFGKRDRRFRVVDIDDWLAAKIGFKDETAPPEQPPPRRRGRPAKAEAIARRGK